MFCIKKTDWCKEKWKKITHTLIEKDSMKCEKKNNE